MLSGKGGSTRGWYLPLLRSYANEGQQEKVYKAGTARRRSLAFIPCFVSKARTQSLSADPWQKFASVPKRPRLMNQSFPLQ